MPDPTQPRGRCSVRVSATQLRVTVLIGQILLLMAWWLEDQFGWTVLGYQIVFIGITLLAGVSGEIREPPQERVARNPGKGPKMTPARDHHTMTEEKKDMPVENTSKRDDLMHLAGAMAEGTSGYITGMEAAGQAQLVNSTLLPYPQDRDDAPFEALGFKFGKPAEGDDLFRDAELPEGWAREGSDHAMWSHIVDERGFRRVAIFYKAAFYDRRADMHIVNKTETKAQADTYEAFDEWCGYPEWTSDSIKDGDNLVRRAKQCALDANGKPEYDREAHDWKRTGLVRERVIAPDGTTLAEREYHDEDDAPPQAAS